MLSNLKFPVSIKFSENFESGSENYIVFQIDEGIIDELRKNNTIEVKGTKNINQSILRTQYGGQSRSYNDKQVL